ncbi:MAG: hypothetical protein KFW09_05320 [Oscillospiraceae bacterium]|nr:hypothetical protein [Oscillospiraceae bacterium]
MKVYTIVGGVNGVGKSSLTGVLKAERTDLGFIIDVDYISKIDKINNISAGRKAIKMIDDFLLKGISFTQETTLSGRGVINTISKAKANGYTINLFYIGLDSCDESISRVENRVRKGGHHISKTDIIRRYHNRFNTLVKVIPFCDKVIFYDNENKFDNIAEYLNGEIILKSNTKVDWLDKLSERLSQSY